MIDPTPPPSAPKLTVQRIVQSLDHTWDRLTVPAATIQDRERRQQVRLLSSLLLALILTITLTLIIRTISGILWQNSSVLVSLLAIVILIGIYGLSRTRHYTTSATLTVATSFVLIHTAPLWVDRAYQALFYAGLPILLSGMLLSLPAMLGVAAVSIGNILLLALISPLEIDLYIAPMIHTLIITAIIVAFIRHRDLIEHERTAELQAVNAALQAKIGEQKRAEEALRASEERFALAVRGSNDGIWDWDLVNHTLYWSPRLIELRGYDPDDLDASFDKFESQLHPNDEERVMAAIEAHLKDRMPYNVEERLRSKSGEYRWFRARGQAIWDETGRPLRMVGSTTDITEQKQAEEQLRFQAQLLDSVRESVIATDLAGHVIYWGKGAEALYGYRAEEVMSRCITFIVEPEEEPEEKERMRQVYETGLWRGQYQQKRKDGTLFWADTVISLVTDGHGRASGLIGIDRDSTQRRQVEAALRQSETRFAKVFHANPAAIVLSVLATGRYLDVNDSYLCLVGYRREEILGRTAPELGIWVNPLERTRLVEAVRQHGSVRDMEITVRRKSGEIRYGLVSAELIDLDGEPCLLGMLHDITERKQAEEALRKSEEKYRLVVESSLQGITIFQGGLMVFVNPAMCQIMGYSATELTSFSLEQILATVHPEDRAMAIERYRTRLQSQPVSPHYEYRIVRRDGTLRWLETSTNSMVYEGEPGLLSISLDITERKRLEEQLRQAQKMEAIGQLAGGIAHDFNNILTVIKGYTGLLLQDLDPQDPLSKDIGQIQKSAERAAALTRQLLAFSRKQMLQPTVLDFNAIVTNMDKMLRRLIGEDINLTTLLDPTLGWVKADPGQMEQVIMNLAINAREAMPNGGQFTIETANVELDVAYARLHIGVNPGPYIRLTLTDTGHGMDGEIRSHIFEPFFTTREQGTGLGLATVHGIINQSGGHICVYSEPGQGTTFKVHLPRVEEAGYSAKPDLQSATPSERGSETILLVEDEASVRELAHRILLNEGYIVLEASHGEAAALGVAEQHQGSIDLLVTDVVMPGGMSGRQLVECLTPLRREMKVLYMSGYTDDAIVRHGVLDAGIAFLQKPFTLDRLARKVHEILDTPQ